MTEREFWEATPLFFDAKRSAWAEAQRREWDRSRFVAFFVIKTIDAAGAIKSPRDIYPFPWDEAAVIPQVDMEELQRLDREADIIYQRMIEQGVFQAP